MLEMDKGVQGVSGRGEHHTIFIYRFFLILYFFLVYCTVPSSKPQPSRAQQSPPSPAKQPATGSSSQ